AHLVGYKGDLYGRIVTVELLRQLRDERRFPSLEELKRQMEQDVEQVCAIAEQAAGQVH
ncbi:MAG: riboflavin kinase, partial [Clostridia bacterium]|nr:riboflavin kinase [Clostridia bacterium]